jgi:hypothetical protein
MGDVVPAVLQAAKERMAAALRDRIIRLAGYGQEPNADWGETPAGLQAAFAAGARPPWPGPRARPELMARWRDLRRMAPTGEIGSSALGGSRFFRPASFPASNAGWQGSRNWSGAIATARDGERFTALTARWRVPGVREGTDAPPAIPGPEGSPPSRRCSVWIGLDGHSAMSRSLPQIGTTTTEVFAAEGRTVECYAWAQWWVRGESYGEVIFRGFHVSPGDEMRAWLALHAPDRVVMCIRNLTSGAEDAVMWKSGAQPGIAGTQVHAEGAPVQGQAAAWIVERPTVMGATDLYPLPDFDAVTFEDCIAGLRAPFQPFHEVADLRDLSCSRLVRMVDRRAGPWRSCRLAVPARDPADRTRLILRRQAEARPLSPAA